jgi:hypothetical protein
MRRLTSAAAMAAALLSAPGARAGDAFDATGYLQRKAAEAAPAEVVREDVVVIKGVRYRRLRAAAGTVYVPETTSTPASLETGLCANEIPIFLETCGPDDASCRQRNRDRLTNEVTVVRAEQVIAPHTKAYAEVLTLATRKSCNVGAPSYLVPLVVKPEIGIEWKDEKKRQPTTYKLFNEGLKPNVGLRTEW